MTDADVPVESLLAHREWVRRVARALTRSDADADDLAQDAWVRALEGGPREQSAVRRWFRTVMRHAARDAHRGDERRRAREAASSRPEAAAAGDVADVVAEAEAHRRVVDAVMALDEPYRAALLLRWFRDVPVEEVARRTGVPLETARTRLRRGLALLRERFDREHGGDRRAWGVALLPLLRPEGSAVATGAATGATPAAWITGALLMGTKTKVAAAAILALLLGGGVVWVARQRIEPPTARPGDVETSAADVVGRSGTARAVEVETTGRARATPPAAVAPVEVPVDAERADGFVVRGRVLDDATGEPVAGAYVFVGSEFARMPENEPGTKSRDDGSFRIARAAAGTFGNVFVRAEGYAEMVFRLAWMDPTEKREAGDAGDLRILRGSSIEGRVVAADGTTPVPGARILLSSVHGAGGAVWINLAGEWGKADARGRFALEKVPPSPRGHYTLFAASEDGIGWKLLPPTVGREPCSDLVVRLAAGGPASVRVRDADGTPRGGVQVVASARFAPLGPDAMFGDHHDAWVMPDTAAERVFVRTTDADGSARFDGLPFGRYDFVAWHLGTNSWATPGFLIEEGGHERTAEIVLRDPGAWAVEGVVRTVDGVPLAGVELTPQWGPKPQVTAADGRYRFEGLEATWTEFRITATREGFSPAEIRTGSDGSSKLVREDVVLERALPIEGKVVDREGRPVEGAAVSFQRAVPSYLVRGRTSGPDGRFAIPDAAAGSWNATVFPPPPYEHWGALPEMPPVRGGDREVTFVLERAEPGKARLVAEVVGADGKSVAPAEAMLLRTERSPRSRISVPLHGPMDLTTGKVVVERVRPGNWRLWVRVDGNGVAVEDVTVPEGAEDVKATVTLRAPGTLRGRVEMPVEGARLPYMVTIAPAGGASQPAWAQYRTPRFIGAEQVGAGGTFLFEGLVPGRYRLTCGSTGFEGEVECDVPSGGEGTVVLRPAQVGVLSFRLAAPSPADTVVIEIARDGGDWTTVMRWGGQKDRESRHDSNVAPGRVRWRVSFPATDAIDAPDAARPAEGEIDVAVGEPVVVTVPVVVE